MKYKFLKKFLRLRDGDKISGSGSTHVFGCGIGYYYAIGGLAICSGIRPDIHNVAFVLQVKDLSKAWRKRLADHASGAEYDLTVRKIGASS